MTNEERKKEYRKRKGQGWKEYEENREKGFRIYKAICDALCLMLACNGGDRFWPDHVACLVDYIIKEEGNVPAPEMNGGVPYPCNYPRPYDDGRRYFLPEEIAM